MPYDFPNDNGVLTPVYKVCFGGKEIPQKYYDLIQSISYEDHESGSDLATITMNDPQFLLLEDTSIIRGAKVSISGGWKNKNGILDMVDWLDGYITLIDVDFPTSGCPVLTINCMDESFILDRKDTEGAYAKCSFAQLVQIIINKPEYRGRFSIATGNNGGRKVHDEISQTKESDLKLLLRMADEENLGFKVQKGKIYWWDTLGTYQKQESEADLHWKEPPFSMQAFSCRLVLSDNKTEVTESNINNNKVEEDGTGKPNPKHDGIIPTDNYTFDENAFWEER